MNDSPFYQTSSLFRFSLSKEKIYITLWLLGALFYVFIGIIAFVEIYNSPAERELMAQAMQNPAMEALFGRAIGVNNYTIGAMYSHLMTMLGFILFAVMSILIVVRNTRTEEEEGLTELIQAQPMGRLSHTASALGLLLITNLLLALFSSGILLLFGDESIGIEGAILTGVLYATTGVFFGAVALVTAQLSASARGAMMLAFGVLGLSFILRVIGDSGVEILSWLSPLGLLYGTEPFVSNNWWPILIILCVSIFLVLCAFYLKQKRDLGSGLLPERTGRRHASSFLQSLFGLNFRLFQTPFIVWTVTVIILGITYGSVIGDVEGMLGGNEIVEQIVISDSSADLTVQFISLIIGVLSIFTIIPALQALLRISKEENKNRMDHILAGTQSRIKIIFSFFSLSILISIWIQFVQVASFAGAAAIVDYKVLSFSEIFQAGFAYLPAIWFIIALAALLIGWLPKLSHMIWLYLGFVFIALYFGEIFDLPGWAMDLSVFHHIPEIPIDSFSWEVTIILSLLTLGLTLLGFVGYRRRDIN